MRLDGSETPIRNRILPVAASLSEYSDVHAILYARLVAGGGKIYMSTHRKLIFALPTNLFAVLLPLLATCLAASSQARSQSTAERNDVYLIYDGDSMNLNGSPRWTRWLTGGTFLSFALPLLNRSVHAMNTSIPGQSLRQMVDRFSNNVGSKYDSKYRVFIVHSLGGGNDIRAGTSATQVYAHLQAYVRSVRALGSNAIAIVSTYPLQCDIFKAQPHKAAIQSYNDLIYAGWNKPQMSGGLGADGLVDYFADPTIGPNTYSYSAFCNTEWSRDGQHLNDGGKAIMGKIEAKAIARFLATRSDK